MTRLQFTIAVSSALCVYLILVFWKKPITTNGRFIRGLSFANVASWIVVLPLSSRGHPPDVVIYGMLLWLINSPVLIVLAVATWVCFKSGAENRVFTIAAAVYVGLNMLLMWVLPATALLVAGITGQ